jgi:hypothetical protein
MTYQNINELNLIVLTHDVEEYSLKQGDIGTAVHIYKNNTAYEVEFITGGGETLAVLTLTPNDIRPINEREILHARELAPA